MQLDQFDSDTLVLLLGLTEALRESFRAGAAPTRQNSARCQERGSLPTGLMCCSIT